MLNAKSIAYLEAYRKETEEQRGTEYGRWYGLLTAQLEHIDFILDNPYNYDSDYDFTDEDLGVESATVAEDWCEDFIYQVLDELYDCDSPEKFYAKFTTTCSLAWLYFWDVKFWEDDSSAYTYLHKENEERCDGDEQPLPQWVLDEMAVYAS